VDGPSLSAINLAISSGNGTLVDNLNGTWSYTPALNDDTAVTFNRHLVPGRIKRAKVLSCSVSCSLDFGINEKKPVERWNIPLTSKFRATSDPGEGGRFHCFAAT